MSDDLEKQKEENRNQHETIVSLTAKLKDMEEKLNKVHYNPSDVRMALRSDVIRTAFLINLFSMSWRTRSCPPC